MSIDFSAKITEVNEITPDSNYVFLYSDGFCSYDPRFDLSATHCSFDITWFPFDVQSCEVVFTSWILSATELSISLPAYPRYLDKYRPSDEWTLECTLAKPFAVNVLNSN